MNDLTCIHAQAGLCPNCQAQYDYDPDSYWEFGDHQEGIARWQALQEELAARTPPASGQWNDPDIPF